jgi:hypothetical protein
VTVVTMVSVVYLSYQGGGETSTTYTSARSDTNVSGVDVEVGAAAAAVVCINI